MKLTLPKVNKLGMKILTINKLLVNIQRVEIPIPSTLADDVAGSLNYFQAFSWESVKDHLVVDVCVASLPNKILDSFLLSS